MIHRGRLLGFSVLVNVLFLHLFGSEYSRSHLGRVATTADQRIVVQPTSNVTRVRMEKEVLEGDKKVWPKPNDVIYGHIHLAKTAGSEINGELAVRYERICGHKGYSYDAYEHNNRGEAWKKRNPDKMLTVDGGDADTVSNKGRAAWNRGRVPFHMMAEIGYQDCDWISYELGMKIWNKVIPNIRPWPLELHVPCREPISFLLSMCNHNKKEFNCSVPDDEIAAEASKCFVEMDRFNYQKVPKNTTLKCFNPIPIEPYIEYMGARLQPRRFVRPYVHRDSNNPRNKDEECLRKDENMQAKVKKYLVENVDMFHFCDKCVGSKDDLLAAPHTDDSNTW